MSVETATVVESTAPAPPGFWHRALRHKSFMIGAGLTLVLVLMALISLVWTPHSATAIDVKAKLKVPGFEHLLGTDFLGRDIFSMIMVGAQNSIMVGVIAVSIGVVGGIFVGLSASAKRGWVEEVLMRLTDLTFGIPAILIAILITAGWGPGITNSILAIGIYNIALFSRVSRGAANAIWAREFVLAARAAGKGKLRISIEHILPNILSVIVVQATIQFAIAILAEAALSYLGLGTQPPTPSWGKMLSDNQTFALLYPRLAIFPGLAIMAAVLGLNMLGDGLRDLLDPRLARKR
jgi:peptide/nickel transport system permease protein